VFSALLWKYKQEKRLLWDRATAERRVPFEAASSDLERHAIEMLKW